MLDVCLWCCSLLRCGVRWHKSPHRERDLCHLSALVQQQVHWELESLLNQCRLQQMCHLLKSTSFSSACVLITCGSTFFAVHMQHASISIFEAMLCVQLTEKGVLILRQCWQMLLVSSSRNHADLDQCCYRSLKQELNTSNPSRYQCKHGSLVPQRSKSPV